MNRTILAIGACALAAMTATAETWYWNGVSMTNGNGQTSNYYYWNNSLNWTNSTGQTGMPMLGDTAVLGAQKCDYAPYQVSNSSAKYALDGIIWPGPNTRPCNQGSFSLRAGGQGFRYMMSKGSGNSYCGVLLVGEGEVPIYVAEGGSLIMQKSMKTAADANGKKNPVLVKDGLGTFVCFYGLSDGAYQLPLALIRQGVYNVMLKSVVDGCEFCFDGDDPSQILEFSWSTSGNHLQLQNCAIRETNGVANTSHGIRSAYDYQVQFTGTPKVQEMVFSGTFYGGAGLKWAPASSGYSFVCSNAVSATTGRVEVANGTMKLVTGASFTALAELTVGSGAVFDVDDASGANFHAEALTLGDATAQLKLPAGRALSFTAGSLGGSPLPAGTFTGQSGTDGTKVDWIDGAGTVTMETGVAAIATWTGEGGVDTLVTTADNWGGTLPDLTSGDTFASFATGGSLATLPVETVLAFSGWRLSGGFDFAAAEGATPAAIGENGITVMDAATATAYSFGWPLHLAAGQTWQLGANTTVDVDAPITGAYGLTVTGAGTLNLKTPQTGFSAPLDISCAKINLFGLNPLGVGSTAASLCVDNGAPTFENITNDRPINIYLDAQASGSLTLKGTNVFNATLKMAPKNMTLTITADKDSVSVFKGTSINTDGQASVYLRGTGHIITSNTLFGINTSLYMNSSNKDYVTVDTWAGMGVGGVFWGDLRYGRINTHVPNVLYGNGTYHRLSIASPGVLDLCGNDQALGAMASSGGTVTSETPALLHLNASTKYDDYGGLGRTNQVVFAGAAGFSHDGYLTNRLSAASTTVGTLKVTTGMLRLVGNASWANSTNVVVTGGTLAFENAAAITKAATVRVDGAGKIALDFDGTMTCDRLFVNGVNAGSGMFGAIGSGAQVESEIFSGTGRLLVIGRGTMMVFR